MKFAARIILATALLFAAAARADHVGLDLSSTSPAGASSTVVGATSATQIGMFTTCSFYVAAQGGTGGTLDIYVQTLFKSLAGSLWVDVAHLPQLAAAGPLTAYTFTLTRWSPTTSAIFTPVNTASGTPLLAVNTVVPGVLGYQLRVVYKTGAGNTVGAAQVILATCSDT